jgi:hypothetical protein
MNLDQCLAVVNRLRTHFPFWGRTLTTQSAADLAEDWAMILEDVDPKFVSAALASLLAEEREFPPNIGNVNTKARKLMAEAEGIPQIDTGEAWRRVTQAVVGSGYGAVWEPSAKAKLTGEEVQAGEAFGLLRIRTRLEENAGTDYAQFRGIYEAYAKRASEARNTPPMVRSILAQLAASFDAKRLSAPKEDK